jgi:putative cardiolipin synthase
MRLLKVFAALILLTVLFLAVVRHYSALPPLAGRTASTVILETDATPLGRAIAPLVKTHPGQSGIYTLANGRDAFAARALLAMTAERTLDVQYYIWQRDLTGTLLLKALHDAAEKGVRVRLLLDDNNTAGLDRILAAVDAHPNLEIRLFNPFIIRQPRWIGFLTDFPRLNRRMHNKSFTVDNQATIIGGRNVGDEYFGAAEGSLFVDLDVLAVGPIVTEVSRDFDRYWASASAYPANLVLSVPPEESIAAAALQLDQNPAADAYVDALRASPFVDDLLSVRLPLEWAETRMVSDNPAKVLGRAPPEEHLIEKLRMAVGEPTARLELISAYFVPSEPGTRFFTDLATSGVEVSVLTNSLAATDVALVHSGYAKYRKALLEAGIDLYELKRLASTQSDTKRDGSIGSSGAASLHAKTFAVDGSHIFIGSFNFDPRSARLNTELGFVIDSKPLAKRTEELFSRSIPQNSYHVHLSSEGYLYWTTGGAQPVRYDTEPDTTFFQRASVWFLSFLPIDWLL